MNKVLVVDDNEENRYLLKTLLEGHGFNVELAGNGSEALEKAKSKPPDIIISDILMPVMDGFVLCRKWKEDDQLKEIPFIFYTATYTDPKDEIFALSLGADRFIVKPMEPDGFLEVINSFNEDMAKGKLELKKPILKEDKEVFKLYSERLVNKLEKKIEELKKENLEHKWTEEALKVSESKLKQAQELAHIGSWYLDIVANKLEWSDEVYRIFGMAPGKPLTYEEFVERVHPEDRAVLNDTWEAALNHEPYDIEHRILVNDEIKWVREKADVEFDKKGRAIEGIGTIQDITESKRAENNLKRSEEKYRSVFESFIDLYFQTNIDGVITELSPSCMTLTHYEPKELIGRSATDIFAYPSEYNKLWDAMLRNDRVNDYEITMLNKENRKLLVSVNSHIVYDGNGMPIKVEGTLRDITDRKKIEEQLRQAQKMESIGTLAGGIAHDFNNILGAIMGYAELAKSETNRETKINRYLEEVLKAGNRASELVNQILTFSRKTEQARKPVFIQTIIKEALKLMRSSLPSTIDIQKHIDDCEPVLIDSTQIHQVIMNLSTNAYQAMREHGGIIKIDLREVEISDENESDKVELRSGRYNRLIVSDTGSGMDRETQKRIFEPYFTTKEKSKGTGLGLAIVHGIVKSCGGSISVHSKPGKGTTFKIWLPVYSGCEDIITEEESIDFHQYRGHEHVLFVDDEESLAKLGKIALQSYGYRVTSQTSSIEALDLFCDSIFDFDIVITDMTMPKMTGYDIAIKMKEIRPDIPIILCTGFSEIVSEEKALKASIDGYIKKPIVVKNLVKVMRKLLNKKKSKSTTHYSPV